MEEEEFCEHGNDWFDCLECAWESVPEEFEEAIWDDSNDPDD